MAKTHEAKLRLKERIVRDTEDSQEKLTTMHRATLLGEIEGVSAKLVLESKDEDKLKAVITPKPRLEVMMTIGPVKARREEQLSKFNDDNPEPGKELGH